MDGEEVPVHDSDSSGEGVTTQVILFENRGQADGKTFFSVC